MELLAHISAKTSKEHDDRYKAQFLAYLDFEPVETRGGSSQPVEAPGLKRRASTPATASNASYQKKHFQLLEEMQARHKRKFCKHVAPSLNERNNLLNSGSRPAPICLDTQLGYAAIESQIYSSSFSSLGSRSPMERPAKRACPEPKIPGTQDAPVIPASSSSGPGEAALPPGIRTPQPTRILKTPSPAPPSSLLPDTYCLSKSSQGSGSHTSSGGAVVTTINVSNRGTITKLQDSLTATQAVSASQQGKAFAVLRSQAIEAQHGVLYAFGRSETGISGPHHSNTDEGPKTSSCRVSQRQEILTLSTERSSPKSCTTPTSSSAAVSKPTSSQLQQLSFLPKEIWASAPAAHTLDWSNTKSHLTPELLALEEKLGKRYRPALEIRPLNPWERGYWLLDTNTWPVGIQIRFWEFLRMHLGRGAAGFATWSEMETKMSSDGMLAGLGRVKIWCWGDQVKHMYLLILVASKLGVWKTGAEWRGWKGDLVVQVRPRSVKRSDNCN